MHEQTARLASAGTLSDMAEGGGERERGGDREGRKRNREGGEMKGKANKSFTRSTQHALWW